MMLLVPGRMEWGHIHCNQGHGAALCKMPLIAVNVTPFHAIRGMVQPCAKCADRKTGNKGRGTGVPQPFLFVGLVGQLRKRGFGK